VSISPFFDLVLHSSGAYKTLVSSSVAPVFVDALPEDCSEESSVAANIVVTKVKSNKHVDTRRRRAHDVIFMVLFGVC